LLLQLTSTGTPSLGVGVLGGGSGPTQNLEALLINAATPGSAVAVGAGGTVVNASFFKTNFDVSGMTTLAPSVTLRGLASGNGYYVAAGDRGTIFSSVDGMNWTQRFSGDSPSTLVSSMLLGAAYSPALQRFVVTGAGGTILVSNSAPTAFGNVSTRGYVSNTQTFIGGFVVEGTAPRTVLIRADGPALGAFSVPNTLPDPVLKVYASNGYVVAANSGWTTQSSIADPSTTAISNAAKNAGAFALPNPSADSALLITLQPGAYTAEVTPAGGNSGIILFEAYTD
jgi:hypothetical protein